MTTGTGGSRPSVLRRYIALLRLLLLLLGWLLLLGRPALLLRRLLLRRPSWAALRLRLRLRGRVLRRRVLHLRRLGRCRTVEIQPRSVGRIAETHSGSRTDFHLVDPLALHISAVGAAVVLNYPTTAPQLMVA